MRPILLIILTFFISTIASAKCAGNGIYLLSKSSTLNKNGLIVLEFYASSQSIIQDLNKKYPIYLQSKKSKITLVAIEVLRGEFQITQVVLKPNSDLIENETYVLSIDNLPKYERKPQRYNEQTQKWENLSFKILNIVDTETPVLKNSITETKKTMVYYGCGPAKWVYFEISGQDKSELFVKASIKSKLTGKTTDYILSIENGQVKVGHGMCSGAFHYETGVNYEVTFSLFDQSGNKSEPTKAISFTCPTKETNDE